MSCHVVAFAYEMFCTIVTFFICPGQVLSSKIFWHLSSVDFFKTNVPLTVVFFNTVWLKQISCCWQYKIVVLISFCIIIHFFEVSGLDTL